MKRSLFIPFDLKKWFVVGFTAFLAGQTTCGFQGGPSFSRRERVNWDGILYFPQRAWGWLGDHHGWAMIILFAIFLICIIAIVIAWLSSRGKFMFLDNVVHDRSNVIAPWNEYKHEGNSFFLFNLLLGFLIFVVLIAYIVQCFTSLQALYERSGDWKTLIGPAILAGVGFLAISFACGFIRLLLNDFVVPIMYRNRSTTWSAIQKFFPLFLSQLFYFVVYGLFLLFLLLVIGIGIFIAGCVTCCIGFVILGIPYISAIILLPLSYTQRAFAVEFLEQFGSDFHIFPRPNITPPDTQSMTA
jgi:hypothetical protein